MSSATFSVADWHTASPPIPGSVDCALIGDGAPWVPGPDADGACALPQAVSSPAAASAAASAEAAVTAAVKAVGAAARRPRARPCRREIIGRHLAVIE